MYLDIFLADFAVFRVFWGISRKYLNFAGPRPREISEALIFQFMNSSVMKLYANYLKSDSHINTASGVGNHLVYSVNR